MRSRVKGSGIQPIAEIVLVCGLCAACGGNADGTTPPSQPLSSASAGVAGSSDRYTGGPSSAGTVAATPTAGKPSANSAGRDSAVSLPVTPSAGAAAAAGASAAAAGAPTGGSSVPPSGASGASGAEAVAGSEAAAGEGATAVAGQSGAAGSGSAIPGGSGGAAAPMREDLGKGNGRDVVTIGDSWMSNTLLTGGAIEGALDRLTMQPYRHYAVQGVMLLSASAFGAAIPTQYASAKRADPNIKTVIMTGGGNDIIQNPGVQASCNQGGPECVELLGRISAKLDELWTQMAEDGVQDVVYINYSRDAGSTDDSVRGMMKPIAICLTGKIRCHAIDSTPAVMGDLQDGIHPTRAANDRLAKVIYELMEKQGIRR